MNWSNSLASLQNISDYGSRSFFLWAVQVKLKCKCEHSFRKAAGNIFSQHAPCQWSPEAGSGSDGKQSSTCRVVFFQVWTPLRPMGMGGLALRSREFRGCSLEVNALLCPILCNPVGCSPWNPPGQNTRVGSCSLLQRIFPTQELNRGLPHCGRILYQLSYQGSPPQPWGLTAPLRALAPGGPPATVSALHPSSTGFHVRSASLLSRCLPTRRSGNLQRPLAPRNYTRCLFVSQFDVTKRYEGGGNQVTSASPEGARGSREGKTGLISAPWVCRSLAPSPSPAPYI